MVNIGAGPAGKAGWVNLDGFRATGINCLCDARRRLPFPDGSVRGIFTEHFVEHLDYTEEVPDFISECYRALEPGGAIRIIFPDIEMYLKAYTAGGWEELREPLKIPFPTP
jgi:predicted SAM-dependent methyltransferase